MWTDDRLHLLEEYLTSNEQRLLIVHIDPRTSTLELLHSIPSIDISHGLCYFIRKNNTPHKSIVSIEEFLQTIQFGYIHGNSISCLTALVSTLFGPLFMDNTTVRDRRMIIVPCAEFPLVRFSPSH